MSQIFYHRSIPFLRAALLLLLFTTIGSAQMRSSRSLNDAGRRSREAAEVLRRIMSNADYAIPRKLLSKAKAIAVFPGVSTSSFIIGGRGGQGVISQHRGGGWSAPVFFYLEGGLGTQIGAAKSDVILLILREEVLIGLASGKLELGSDVSVAAGPYGRSSFAVNDMMHEPDVLSYTSSKGSFTGVALKGATIIEDEGLNQSVYGMKANAVLASTQNVQPPSAVSIFPQTLKRYVPCSCDMCKLDSRCSCCPD